MNYPGKKGVPAFCGTEFQPRQSEYAVLIPVINEGRRIRKELFRAYKYGVFREADIIICDGGSTDGSLDEKLLRKLHVNSLLVKQGEGRQGAQLRMGIWWGLRRGYKGFVTIDGNNKDSIEDVWRFIVKLKEGYDYVQGSRFIKGGHGVRTPLARRFAVRFIHAPIISFTAHQKLTDTTNAFRGYSAGYLLNDEVQPLRDIFSGYELLAYLSVRASQLGMRVCEIPVSRVYPKEGKLVTKISPIQGNMNLLRILVKNLCGCYAPRSNKSKRLGD